jgi:adenosylmethionine-8-amino-7-oxononanoate aminotransferase
VGVVRYPDTHRWGEKEPRPVAESLQGLEDVIRYEGAHTIAAIFLETIVGTNGILIPPDGYLKGVRELCDRYGILMVCDEVMAGFGRTGPLVRGGPLGTWPDLMTMAKGLTSSYLPLGAVAMRDHIAEHFDTKMFYGGLTYSSHPVSLAASLATIGVYEEDDLIGNAARLGRSMRRHHEALARSTRAWARTGASACSASSTSSAARTRGRRSRRSTAQRRDEGDRQVLPPERPVHDDRQQLDPHQPAAVHHRGAAGRGLRDHRPARSTSPTRPSRA